MCERRFHLSMGMPGGMGGWGQDRNAEEVRVGELALLAAYERTGDVPVRAVVVLYPPSDLARVTTSGQRRIGLGWILRSGIIWGARLRRCRISIRFRRRVPGGWGIGLCCRGLKSPAATRSLWGALEPCVRPVRVQYAVTVTTVGYHQSERCPPGDIDVNCPNG